MLKENAEVIDSFKKTVISHLEDLLITLPAVIPQTPEDEVIFRDGIRNISKLVYDLKHCESIRELGKYFDIDKILEDYDIESIKHLESNISSRANIMLNRIEAMIENDED